jgi:3',5'-nucleoside bisphosphate phosphatase
LPSNFDLHSHSTVSDGLLSPEDLVAWAARRGVEVLSLTDHDDVGGLAAARCAARAAGIGFVPGVEVSVTWGPHTLHIVGLGIDPDAPELAAGLAAIRHGRRLRAERMAESLARCGIRGVLEGALAYATNPNLVGRTHFARYLVERGCAKSVKSVFKHYLVKGKPGYVPHAWAALGDAVAWIRAAGGQAVIAHPARYDLGPNAMARLLEEFRALGGVGIEVVSGNHTRDQVRTYARRAAEFELLASRGSDYHGPGESWVDPAGLPFLPPDCVPIWRDWAPERLSH